MIRRAGTSSAGTGGPGVRSRRRTRIVLRLGRAYFTFVVPTLASGVLALTLYGLRPLVGDPLLYVALSPLLYLLWLVLILAAFAAHVALLGRFGSKPEIHDRTRPAAVADRLILGCCYSIRGVVSALPLVGRFLRVPLLWRLVLRSYAPRHGFSPRATINTFPQDPDLTVVGGGSVLGTACRLVAHSSVVGEGGGRTYRSAPIRIGRHVTIGGTAQIEMGVRIGDGAIVGPGSRVAPFTRIGPGEVWQGNPAVLVRRRGEAVGRPSKPGSTDLEDLVRRTFGIEDPRIPLESDAIAAWDSLGRLALAAALQDEFGTRLTPAEIDELSDIESCRRVLRGEPPAGRPSAPIGNEPELLPLHDVAEATRALAARGPVGPTAGEAVSIAVASTFVAEPLRGALRLWAGAFGLDATVDFLGFDGVERILLDEHGPLPEPGRDLAVVLVRHEDIEARPGRPSRVDGLLEALAVCHRRGTPLLVSGLARPLAAGHDRGRFEATRARWLDGLRELPGIELLDVEALLFDLGRAAAEPGPGALLPFSQAVYRALGVEIVRCLVRRRRPARKVLAVDCDDTLWAGTVGEDGLAGLDAGRTARGRVFQALQRRLLALRDRGVLLTLLSRNEPADVSAVFDQLPGMVLQRDHIVASRIDFRSKAEMIEELAGELGLGLDAFVVIDDDPAQRLEMSRRQPDVFVLPDAGDPSKVIAALDRLWIFDGAGGTREDALRQEHQGLEPRRTELRTAARSVDAYLEALELEATVSPPGEEDLLRLAQLSQRTNQFNASLKRFTVDQLAVRREDHPMLMLSASDRFGDYGIVGWALFAPPEPVGGPLVVDAFMMSCRALGRGLEETLLHGAFRLARQLGSPSLSLETAAGPRNRPALEFLLSHGFVTAEGGLMSRAIPDRSAPPAHVALRLE